MKQTIKIKESELKQIISESLKKVLQESDSYLQWKNPNICPKCGGEMKIYGINPVSWAGHCEDCGFKGDSQDWRRYNGEDI